MGGSRRVPLPGTRATRAKSRTLTMDGSRRVPLPTKSFTRRRNAARGVTTQGGSDVCVLRRARRGAAGGGERARAAAGRGAPRVLPLAPNTWLVVANVPLKAFGQDALDKRLQDVDWMSRCGVAHQAVMDSFLDSDAVVPMTLFTIFANDERALAEARKDPARLEASLDRVAGRAEWVVRVLRGEAAASGARRGRSAHNGARRRRRRAALGTRVPAGQSGSAPGGAARGRRDGRRAARADDRALGCRGRRERSDGSGDGGRARLRGAARCGVSRRTNRGTSIRAGREAHGAAAYRARIPRQRDWSLALLFLRVVRVVLFVSHV